LAAKLKGFMVDLTGRNCLYTHFVDVQQMFGSAEK